MPTEIKIPKDYEGISPKNYLKKIVDESYNSIFRYIKDKRITLNGKKIKDDVKLREGDVIKFWLDSIKLKQKDDSKKEFRNLKIPLIFENNDFLVLNKLPGIVVQGAQDTDLALSIHLEFLKRKNKENSQYFHVHRLDKETSGVLICSKNLVSRRELNKTFKDKEMVKKYVCLCEGEFKNSKGKIEVYLDRNQQGIKEKMRICDKNSGKYSLSYYKVLKKYRFKKDIFSLVEVEIKTGMTHQIRVHMKYLGHPIVGDWMYGNSFVNNMFKPTLERQFLHAKSLEFNYKDKKYKFEAPLTRDLELTLKMLR